MCILSASTFAQKLNVKDNGLPIDKKLFNALRYDYQIAPEQEADYVLNVFFKGQYSAWKSKPWSAYYLILDKDGKEIYRSEEWKCGGYGGQAENIMVKKIEKDFKKFISKG